MKAQRILAGTGLVLALSLGLAMSCADSFGIYATIQKEQGAATDSVFKQTLVRDVVADGTKYYVPLVAIYSRDMSSSVASGWTAESITGLGTDYTTWGLAATGTTVYAALQKGTAASSDRGIYQRVGVGAWSRLSSSNLDGKTVVALWAIGTEVFAVVSDAAANGAATPYKLWYWNGADFESTSLDASYSITRGVADNGVANYYFATLASSAATSSTVYSAAAAGFNSATTFSQVVPANVPSSIVKCMAATSGAIAFGCADGDVYLGGSMAVSTGMPASIASGTAVLSLINLSAGGTELLVAGSDMETSDSSGGYKEAVVTGSTSLGSFVSGGTSGQYIGPYNYDSTVADMPIVNFFYDSANTRLFACAASGATNYSGLWTTTYDGSNWSASGWKTE